MEKGSVKVYSSRFVTLLVLRVSIDDSKRQKTRLITFRLEHLKYYISVFFDVWYL